MPGFSLYSKYFLRGFLFCAVVVVGHLGFNLPFEISVGRLGFDIVFSCLCDRYSQRAAIIGRDFFIVGRFILY